VDNSIGIGDLAALVTVVGIAVYVMGLVGLSVTIRFNFTGDFTTAWYVVSLLPRTVVAGQGVRLWLRMPIIVTAILLPTAQISGGILGNFLILFITWATFIVAMILPLLALARIPKHPHPPVSILLFVSMIPGYFGIILLGNGASLIAQGPEPLVYSFVPDALEALGIAVEENSFAIGVMLIFFGGFAIGIPSAIVFKPPLPRVKLEISGESAATNDNSTPSEGWLVAHSDGFWHLILEESGELQSIPDGQVLLVRTGGRKVLVVPTGGRTPKTPVTKEAASTEEAAVSPAATKPDEDTKPSKEKANELPPRSEGKQIGAEARSWWRRVFGS
jgi:hypothetical protein